MAEMSSQTYTCQCLGCPNGEGSSFAAAPESWWAEKGMTPPKNCPDCRAWVKEQNDEAIRCEGCGGTVRISARYKISHHKKIGPYSPPGICRACERGVRPPRAAAPRPPSKQTLQRRQAPTLRLPRTRPNTSYMLDTQPVNYQHLVPDGSHTRQQHIEQHTAWSPHSLVGQGKSESALAHQESSFPAILRSANIIAQSSADDRVVEYKARNGYVVKVALTDSLRLEVTVISPTPGTAGHELVTTYDGFTVGQVHARLQDGRWT